MVQMVLFQTEHRPQTSLLGFKDVYLIIDNKARAHTSAKTTPTKSNGPSVATTRSNSKDKVDDDAVSQSSLGGGIKDKLAALLNKEQTISEATIANKFKQEREREMEMLQNRFNYKPKEEKVEEARAVSDDDQSDTDSDPSEKVPLMGTSISMTISTKKPEIIANVPKITIEDHADKDKVSQPVKRRNSQDSPIVLSVLDDVKRIKVNNKREQLTGVVTQQPSTIYPHLSDIETDNSRTPDEYSDCGDSSSKAHQCNENLNQSDNWAETSFGREIMNVVKKKNISYTKAVRESSTDSSEGASDSELDDMLDEALNDEENPTPPKQNKGTLSSNSFVYQEGKHFKSPQKQHLKPRADCGNELVHSVSFYRRLQHASSAPTTPVHVFRYTSPKASQNTTSEPAANAITVRQRIKDLQNEIAKQQSVISQASQALNYCDAMVEFYGSSEQAEGERLLLLACHSRQASLHEMQRLQVEGAGPAGKAGTASLHITELSIPLRRSYVRQLSADGATGHYCVCLLKFRDRVLATSMRLTQPSAQWLRFPDEVRMDGLTSDFKVTIEVYLLPASNQALPHKVKYRISNKKPSGKLLTPKGKMSELKSPRVPSPGGPSAVRSQQFQLHGYCIFALPQATRKSFTLNKVPSNSPLEGSVNVTITARIQAPPVAPHAAFLTAFDDVRGLGAWHRRWCRLQPPTLAFWKYPDDVPKKPPIFDIDLSTVLSEKAVKAPRDICARLNTILIETSVPTGLEVPEESLVFVRDASGHMVRRHLLAADTPAARDKWIECINAALEYTRCTSSQEE
ncbi:hypothetical protein ACJJTC_008156 [Scirpophaga incertulas]